MEFLDSIAQLIQNIGFPIACVIAMFYMMMKEQDRHREESLDWIEALNNNTKVMENVLKKLEEQK